MSAYRRYLIWFGCASLGGILLVGALNLLVDPYDRFGLNRLGVYISAEREFKSTEFPRFAPDAVLLGNSRAALIDVSGLSGHRFFNAAFGSAEVEEMSFFIRRFVKDQKLVVLSLDLSGFGPLARSVANPFQPLTFRQALEYVLNVRNVEYSVRTISKSLTGKRPDLAPDGSFCEANWAAEADVGDADIVRRRLEAARDKLAVYRFDPARLQALRDIRDTLAARGIALRVYLPPIHARVWAGLAGTRGLEEMRRTGEAIKAILPQTVDLTTSEYAAPENFFRADPVHFHSTVGQRFLNSRVLTAEP